MNKLKYIGLGLGYWFLTIVIVLTSCIIFEIQTMKPFTVPEMTFKGYSRSFVKAQLNRPYVTLY